MISHIQSKYPLDEFLFMKSIRYFDANDFKSTLSTSANKYDQNNNKASLPNIFGEYKANMTSFILTEATTTPSNRGNSGIKQKEQINFRRIIKIKNNLTSRSNNQPVVDIPLESEQFNPKTCREMPTLKSNDIIGKNNTFCERFDKMNTTHIKARKTLKKLKKISEKMNLIEYKKNDFNNKNIESILKKKSSQNLEGISQKNNNHYGFLTSRSAKILDEVIESKDIGNGRNGHYDDYDKSGSYGSSGGRSISNSRNGSNSNYDYAHNPFHKLNNHDNFPNDASAHDYESHNGHDHHIGGNDISNSLNHDYRYGNKPNYGSDHNHVYITHHQNYFDHVNDKVKHDYYDKNNTPEVFLVERYNQQNDSNKHVGVLCMQSQKFIKVKALDILEFFHLDHEIAELNRKKELFYEKKNKFLDKRDSNKLLEYDKKLKYHHHHNDNIVDHEDAENKIKESKSYLKGLKLGEKLKAQKPRKYIFMRKKALII